MRLNIRNILTKNLLVIVLILIAIFLRFFKLEEFVTFLGDQGRDAIIIKRIVTFEHFPAIGPISSVGRVFLGPFYYYLMAPFLALAKLNPLGLAVGSAILSLVGLICSYFVVNKINKNLAQLFLVFITFSSVLIANSRFSWNPNLLPFFSFVTLYFLHQAITEKKYIWSILYGASLAFSIQLHYLAMFLFVTSFIFFIIHDKKFWKVDCLKKIFVAFFSYIFCSSPLIIFDLKHDFLNSKNFIKIFTQSDVVSSSTYLNRFWETINNFFYYALGFKVNSLVSTLILLALIIFFIKKDYFKKNLLLQINFLNFFLFLFGFSLLNSFRHYHYYGLIYLSFFLILAMIFSEFFNKKNLILKSLIFIFLIFWFGFNYVQYPFYQKEGNFQIRIAQKIAKSIINRNPQTPYQIVPIPYTEMDGHIRYFLEIMGKTPLSEESNQEGVELYILCYEKTCDALNHPQWQIAAFQNKKVATTWKVDRVLVYKLIHGK